MTRALEILFEVKAMAKKPTTTLAELQKRSKSLREQFNTAGAVKVLNMKPLVGNATMTVNAEAFGKKGKYPMTMTFYNVEYSENQTRDYPLAVTPERGRRFYMPQLEEDGNPVQVRCQCPDFRFTWAHWNKEESALSGRNFARYKRKTETRPERNPAKAPGLCKHLIKLTEKLMRDKVLKK